MLIPPWDTTLHALERAAADVEDNFFIDLSGEILSCRELDQRATRLAHSLAALGIKRGQCVTTLLATSVDVFVCWFAINKLGAIWAPINTAYRGEFLRHQIVDSGGCMVICDAHLLSSVAEIAHRLPEVRLILCRNLSTTHDSPIPIESFEKHRGTDDTPIPIAISHKDVALLIYTSGTTGLSKGCMLSYNYLCTAARTHIATVPHERGDRTWTCLPLFHMAALSVAVAGLISKNGVAMEPQFSVSRFWQQIERSRATSAALLATMFPLLAHAPDNEAMKRCFGQLKVVSGIPVPPELNKIWTERFGVHFMHSYSYGQTEGTRLSGYWLGDSLPLEGSAGRIVDHFDVRIFDENDEPVPDGELGEIVYRPLRPHVMFEGYWRRPEETLMAWRNLWMHTGDLGRIREGHLFFCERKKDYLRSRGENISSYEVERVFASHPAIAQAAVHSTSSIPGDDDIKLTMVLHEGAVVSEREVCLWCISRLPYFAVPRYYEIRTELPTTPSGKVTKYVLREQGVTARTWDREAAGIQVRRPVSPAMDTFPQPV